MRQMKVNLTGLLHNALAATEADEQESYLFALDELLTNLRQLHERKAEGEAVIEEFFACYVVDPAVPS